MTTRREALKLGALAAAPVAAFAPAATLAADDSAARLARMEDEKAITDTLRRFVRRFNGSRNCARFVADAGAICIDPQVKAVREDASSSPQLAFARDGKSASCKMHAEIEWHSQFSGQTTVEKMARFQGQASAVSRASGQLEAQLARTADGWTISHITLA